MTASNPNNDAGDRLERRVLETLAEVDVIETDEGFEFCLDEYRIEAPMIRERLERGETLEVAAFEVFADMCGFDLTPAQVAQIRKVYGRRLAEEQAAQLGHAG